MCYNWGVKQQLLRTAQTDLKDIQKQRLLCVRYFLWTETKKKIFRTNGGLGENRARRPRILGR